MISSHQLSLLSQILQNENITFLDLISSVIAGPSKHTKFTELLDAQRAAFCAPASLNRLFSTLLSTPDTRTTVMTLAKNATIFQCLEELSTFLLPSAGFHFNVSHSPSTQFEKFSTIKIAKTLQLGCPSLWAMFGALLNTVAMSKAARSAVKEGDYLKELVYQENNDIPNEKRWAKAAGSETTVQTSGDPMPDDDWGGHSDDPDSSDESDTDQSAPMEAQGPQSAGAEAAAIPGLERRNIKKGARWRKGYGAAAERQTQRTMVVSGGQTSGPEKALTLV
jgi:hypothetical protein